MTKPVPIIRHLEWFGAWTVSSFLTNSHFFPQFLANSPKLTVFPLISN